MPFHILRDIVQRSGFQGCNRNPAVLGTCHENNRWSVRERTDARQQVEPGFSRHVVIERNDVDSAYPQTCEPFAATCGMLDLISVLFERTSYEARDAGIIVNVQHAGCSHGGPFSGTCMTEKKSPSCRIAFAKFS